MVTWNTVPSEATTLPAGGRGQPLGQGVRAVRAELCRHCHYNPASPRIFGYCSWDCHDEDEEGGPAAA